MVNIEMKSMKIKKDIMINDNILIKNNMMEQKYYSLIGVIHHLGDISTMVIIFVNV